MTLTQAIRSFAKNLEGWLTSSIHGCPTEAINSRVRVFGNVVSIGVWTQRALWLGGLCAWLMEDFCGHIL